MNMVQLHIVVDNQLVAAILSAAGSPTLLSILGGHLLINLKEAGEMGANGGTNYRLSRISDIDFADGWFPSILSYSTTLTD